MKKKELKKKLERIRIPKDWYRLDGGLPNEALCLNNTGAIWEVYYSERGGKSGLRQFKTEEEACDYFYKLTNEIFSNQNM